MDVEGRGLGEERLHAEDRGTGRRDWCSVRPREKEEREREREGEPNTRDIRCVPQDLGQRGVAVIRPGKGRKLAGLGERGKHTRGGGGGNSSSSTGGGGGGGSEGGYSLQGRQREAAEEGLRGERWGWGGDRPAWELGESPSSGPPGGLSASRVGVRRGPQEVWEASPLLGRWFPGSLC